MYTQASTPQDLCYRIKQVCEGEFETLSARPWNRFEPAENLWWLIPATDWPAFKYAKLYFDWTSPDHSALSCGLHVEKGLDRSIHSAYQSKKGSQYIMGTDWAWHPFLADLEQGTVTTAIAKAGPGTDKGFGLKIEGGYVRDPGSFHPYADEFRKTKAIYMFACSGSSGASNLLEAVDPVKLMYGLKSANSLSAIAGQLRALMLDAWLWIDVWLGISLDIQTDRKTGTLISDAELWTKHLRHFAEWLHATG
jgi:hypothetical protein